MGKELRTFKLVYRESVISPPMVTIREYRKWFESTFDEYTVASELYMRAKRGADTVMECHPGTRIGVFFDKHDFKSPDLHSWYIQKDSYMMDKLIEYDMAELRDASLVSVSDKDNNIEMLRVYTSRQIQCYIQTNIDRRFDISSYINTSRHVPVKDISKLIQPVKKVRKGLL